MVAKKLLSLAESSVTLGMLMTELLYEVVTFVILLAVSSL